MAYDYDYTKLLADIESWSKQAVDQGWIEKQIASSLIDVKESTARSLFTEQTRPLVVAFMGGTGVGKSSLLNRLAGEDIAKTGIERPTSREVTLYYHHTVSIHQLKEKFPLQAIQCVAHNEASRQKTLWVDMPDFDSTEQKNKQIVIQWLPYIDLLIYVVSPERYRDHKAWQLLREEGASHAWLFIMNQWDRGESIQYDDFKQQLSKAGFDDPLIYKTICTEPTEDQFIQLQSMITSLATEQTVEHLEVRGIQQCKQQIKQNLYQCLQKLGSEHAFAQLLDYQANSWSETETILKQGFNWPITQLSMTYVKAKVIIPSEKINLWDDWAQNRFNDYLNNLILTADHKKIPSIPLRKALISSPNKAEQIIQTQTELACRQSLINPGNAMQRAFLKGARLCEFILPLIAMGIVGFQIFEGYYNSSLTNQDFLGINFAVHSVLLVLMTWLVPYFIRKKIQPSLEKAALKGLYKGLNIAMINIAIDVKEVVNHVNKQHQETIKSVEILIKNCDKSNDKRKPIEKNDQLKRMLLKE